MSIETTLGGLSAPRLARLSTAMADYIARGEVAGAITCIYRHGVLAHMDVLGNQSDADRLPLQRDTIFRIASMTKPVTSVAALMLLEEGRFGLDDPVER